MRVLVTRPRHDEGSVYLYWWTREIIQLARKKGIELFDLEKEKSNRKNVQGYLRKDQASHVFLNGHGSEVAVYGHDEEELVSVDDAPALFKGKVYFVRACNSAKQLGPEAIKKGARAFMGYTSEFRFWHRTSFLRRPLQDPMARPFMECSNQVAVSLLKGHVPSKANERSKDMYKREIRRAFTSEGDTSILPALVHNMEHQVCIE